MANNTQTCWRSITPLMPDVSWVSQCDGYWHDIILKDDPLGLGTYQMVSFTSMYPVLHGYMDVNLNQKSEPLEEDTFN